MDKKPFGVVTFMFTDIEGSTRLAQEFPDALQPALEIHHGILTEAIESNNGFIFEIIGDAFCAAFENVDDAVKAAIAAQINLAEEKWKDAVIKVRMGIHSGKAEWNGKRYMGYITLARTARVMSASYGEQIIISDDSRKMLPETIALSQSREDTKFSVQNFETLSLRGENTIFFRDLGERRLKDVIKPIKLFQVTVSGLREDFPPLKTLDARPNNLPVQLSSFIGREDEIKQIKELLNNTHLLTLTGSGGSGKTRISLQTGADLIDDFANGVWFVELAPVNDPVQLPQSIISTLKIKEEPNKTLEETLFENLRDKEILIILDNCEHIIDESAEIVERLLSTFPKLKIIATSREALKCSGEQIYMIPVLSHPDPDSKETPEQLTKYESVKLFTERALTLNPMFKVTDENAQYLAEICSRLDGIPLALELAAARTKVLSLKKIKERLDDRFNLLTGGKRTALPRQQTLKALIDYSYDLLDEREKILWSRLSVFNGGWTLDSAEEICADETIGKNEILDLLTQLAEKSIIIYDEEKERYSILETMKQFGEEKLRNKKEIFSKHLSYFKNLSESAEPELKGSNSTYWLNKLEADHRNIQSAIESSVTEGDFEDKAILAGVMSGFWVIRGHYFTGKKILKKIICSDIEITDNTKALLLRSAGNIAVHQGDYDDVKKYNEESLSLAKIINDKPGIAASLNSIGQVEFHRGDFEHAKKLFEESLEIYREEGIKNGIAPCLNNLGNLAKHQGDYKPAKKYYLECLELCRETGNKPGIAISLNNLGNVANEKGDYKLAKEYYEECLDLQNEIGNKQGIAATLSNLGTIMAGYGNFEEAKKLINEGLDICRELGNKNGIAHSLNAIGVVEYNQRNFEEAKKLCNESLMLFSELSDKQGIASSLNNLGNVAFDTGDEKLAKDMYEKSLMLRREIGDKHGIAISLRAIGNTIYNQSDYERAKKLYIESLFIVTKLEDKHGIAVSLNKIASVFIETNSDIKALKLFGSSESILNSMNGILDKDDQNKKEESIKKIREKLSIVEFEKYFEEGKKLTLEEAVNISVNQ